MPVPKPGATEDEKEFHQRCMRWMNANDPEREADQMNAICYGQWRAKESDPGTVHGELSEESRSKMVTHIESVRAACASLESHLNDGVTPGLLEALREADIGVDLLITEAMSYGQQQDLIRAALTERAGKNAWVWIRDMYPDRVVYSQEKRTDGGMDEGMLFQCSYAVDTGNAKVTLGAPVKVKQVTDYVVTEADRPAATEDPLPPSSEAVGRITKTEESGEFTESDYAYVPDQKDPATWQIRIAAVPGGEPDAQMIEAAISAISEIPDDHVGPVKLKLREVWKKANPDKDEIPPAIKEGDVLEIGGEMVPLSESSVKKDGSTKLKLIAPGWGSSGYYPKEVLERDGPGVFTVGLKTFFDHPTKQEEKDRPERSLKELAGVLTSNAEYLADGPAGPGLYADARVFSNYREVIDEMAPHIGVSIRALGRATAGEAEGRKGPIVESIGIARSADFVTAAGAGGRVLPLLESARGAAGESSKPQTEVHLNMDELEEARRELATARAEASANATALQETRRQNEDFQRQITEMSPKVAQFDRVAERLLLREAADLARIHLRASDLPEVTVDRLVKQASSNPPVKDGAVDEPLFVERLQESVRQETAYIATVTESGRVKGMGGPSPVADMEHASAELSRSLGRLGLGESELKTAVNGR